MSVGAHGADRVFVTAGDSLSLNCSATSLDGNSSQHHSDVIWLLNDVPVSNNSELLLTELSHTHHGSNLSCVAGTELVVAAVIAVVHRKSGKNWEDTCIYTCSGCMIDQMNAFNLLNNINWCYVFCMNTVLWKGSCNTQTGHHKRKHPSSLQPKQVVWQEHDIQNETMVFILW